MKKKFEQIKNNIKISNLYLEAYPMLKEYHSKKTPFDKSKDIWNDLINLKINSISHFIHEIEGEKGKYLTGEKSADPIKILKKIKSSIKTYKKNFTQNDLEEFEDITHISKRWEKILNANDFFKVFNKIYDYRTFDFDPFYQYKAELINIIINNDLKYDNDYFDIKDLIKTLEKPKQNSILEIEQLNKDKKEIDKIIEMLIPLCKKAKETDSGWEHNFINNKILSKVKQKIK